nr:MAG TPA: hypothetical protein [Caudoviricetes sp.]
MSGVIIYHYSIYTINSYLLKLNRSFRLPTRIRIKSRCSFLKLSFLNLLDIREVLIFLSRLFLFLQNWVLFSPSSSFYTMSHKSIKICFFYINIFIWIYLKWIK